MKPIAIAGFVSSLAVAGAALVIAACNSAPLASVSKTRPESRADYDAAMTPPPAAPSNPPGWSPVGVQQDALSSDLRSGAPTDGAYTMDGAAGYSGTEGRRYDEVPRIDLQDALRQSQGGGGVGGQSPFRDLAGVDVTPQEPGRVPLLGDVPLVGGDFQGFHRGELTPAPEPIRGPSEFTLRPGEELWVIERRTTFAENAPRSDDLPGSGCLMTMRPVAREHQPETTYGNLVAVPLRHTDVHARIDGYIGTVSVTQQFVNPYSDKIEAAYVFPLPENAAVNDFLMQIGDRTIRGVIRERQEAERIYGEARRQGYTASLLTQERPNIFTQRVANIEPGKQIDVEIKYFHTLAYRDGWFEWAFPMVVGPRFNPPCTTDGVGAVARGQFGASNQRTEVQYLRPWERSGHDIAVHISLDAGVPIESLECKTHQVSVQADRACANRAEIQLSSLDTIPNKDFVLRYRVAGRDVKSAMLTQVTDKGGFFSMLLVPPADLDYVSRGPVEMVFVVDCSGSMEGEPIAQAKRAVEHALRGLDPDDTFQVIDFAETTSQLGAAPLPASWDNVRRGIEFVNRLNASGGTYMINGLRAALNFKHDSRRLRYVCFLTDGYIGNEADILAELRKGLDDSRVFSMGIGSSVNRYLIEEMAKVGRGVATVITPGDDAADAMDKFLGRVSRASMCDLRIDWGGMDVTDVYPKRLPDLYVGRPVLITGRYRGSGETTVKVSGRIGGQKTPILIPVNMSGRDGERGAIAAVWARSKLAELSTHYTTKPDEDLPKTICRTALDYGLMSAYTSFIAVDSMTRTSGQLGTTVEQPVPVPEGIKYETTVHERSAARRLPGQDHP